MQFRPTDALPDVILVEPDVFGDDRGFFVETYHAEKYARGGIDATFVQDNLSQSTQGVLRGLHAQSHTPQGKLVRAVEGEIFDVAVDARIGSPTFGRWVGATLTAENQHQLWVPPGFLHGFYVVSGRAKVEYKCTALYAPGEDLSVAWNDPEIGIDWPGEAPILSPKDAAAPRLSEVHGRLESYTAP